MLQERAVERLGANVLVPLDLRAVAASKVDLRNAAAHRRGREDLYYRLSVVNLTMPPLRVRGEDIPILFHHFLLVASARYGREVLAPTPEQMHRLLSRAWPANVRGLRNAAERYVLLGEHLDYGSMTLPEQVECFERSLIEQQLVAHTGSIKETMAALGLPRKALYDNIKKVNVKKRITPETQSITSIGGLRGLYVAAPFVDNRMFLLAVAHPGRCRARGG